MLFSISHIFENKQKILLHSGLCPYVCGMYMSQLFICLDNRMTDRMVRVERDLKDRLISPPPPHPPHGQGHLPLKILRTV